MARKDNKGRNLHTGESQRNDGIYMYRYTDVKSGKRQTIYAGDLPELRVKEKQIAKDLEDSISGLSALKPILQAQVIKFNGANKRQAAICAAELDWKHGDKKSKEFRKLIDSL